jgi:hypothetical protein
LEVGPGGRVVKELGKTVPVHRASHASDRARQVVLGEDIVDMGEEFGPLASEMEATAQEVAGGAHQGSDGPEEEVGVAAESFVQADLALLAEDAEVEIAARKVDATGMPVLIGIEAHGSPPG